MPSVPPAPVGVPFATSELSAPVFFTHLRTTEECRTVAPGSAKVHFSGFNSFAHMCTMMSSSMGISPMIVWALFVVVLMGSTV